MEALSHRSQAIRLFARTMAFTLIVAGGVTSPANAQALPADAKATCTVTGPQFNGWFQPGTLNGVVNPANSVTFSNPVANCAFYQWSQQMYLWITSPAPSIYGPGAHVFDSSVFYDISIPNAQGKRTLIAHSPGLIRNFALRAAQVGPHKLPTVFDKAGRMFEIEPSQVSPTGKPLVLNNAGKTVEVERATIGANKQLILTDKAGTPIPKPRAIVTPELANARVAQRFMINNVPVILDSAGNVVDVEQGQANGDGVLQAQNGSLVYYVSMVNDVFAYFMTGTANGGITPKPTKFPTTQAELNKIIAFASAHGKTFPDANALAIELKTSWVEAAGLQNPNSYITMNAVIPVYNTKNMKLWTPKDPPNATKVAKLALVGIHVVGSAAGHPEMIWATFEHFGNTPNASYAYVTASNASKVVGQSTAGNWLFSATNAAAPFNDLHMDFTQPPNIKAVGAFNITPSNTIRWKPFGGATDFKPNPLVASTAESNTEIISIDNSVIGKLAAGDIRRNYYMTGSTWTIGGAAPSGSFKNGVGNEVGTSKSANSTMETYQQGSNTLWATGTNCFSCHVTNTTNVSHMFPVLLPLF